MVILPITPNLVFFVLLLLFSWGVGFIGRDYKYGFWGNFLVSMIFTPVVGVLVLLAQDRRVRVLRG